jgi:hypothetical protein
MVQNCLSDSSLPTPRAPVRFLADDLLADHDVIRPVEWRRVSPLTSGRPTSVRVQPLGMTAEGALAVPVVWSSRSPILNVAGPMKVLRSKSRAGCPGVFAADVRARLAISLVARVLRLVVRSSALGADPVFPCRPSSRPALRPAYLDEVAFHVR